MKRTPRSSTEVLDLSLNTLTGEVSVGGVKLLPSGAGCDSDDVRLDDGKAVFDTLVKLRDELFAWRVYAELHEDWVKREPNTPRW